MAETEAQADENLDPKKAGPKLWMLLMNMFRSVLHSGEILSHGFKVPLLRIHGEHQIAYVEFTMAAMDHVYHQHFEENGQVEAEEWLDQQMEELMNQAPAWFTALQDQQLRAMMGDENEEE